MLIRPIPTGAATSMSNRYGSLASGMHGRNIGMELALMRAERDKFDRWGRLLDQMRQKREAEKAAEQSNDGALWGAGAGAAASLVAAPFTGGASLTMMPGFMSAGSQIGGSFDKNPQQGQALSQGLNSTQSRLDELFEYTDRPTHNDPDLELPDG